jgi:hypothetical protein
VRIGYLGLFLWLSPVYAYKTQQDYAVDAYEVLLTYVSTDTSCSNAPYVKKLIDSGPLDDVFNAAWGEGYAKIEIVRQMRRVALWYEPRQPAIIEGIRDWLQNIRAWQSGILWTVCTLVTLNICISIYTIRFFINYYTYNHNFYL